MRVKRGAHDTCGWMGRLATACAAPGGSGSTGREAGTGCPGVGRSLITTIYSTESYAGSSCSDSLRLLRLRTTALAQTLLRCKYDTQEPGDYSHIS